MSQSKPRTTAERTIRSDTDERQCGIRYESPDVRLSVEWEWGDGVKALDLLDVAVADVRAQIEQTMTARQTPLEDRDWTKSGVGE